jgi:hypothetical protein
MMRRRTQPKSIFLLQLPPMITYFKIFVYALFPPAAIMLAFLVLPLPKFISRRLVQATDALLFLRPHPHVPLSLFYCVLLLSFLTFAETMLDVRQVQEEYRMSKSAGGRSDKALIRLLAEERNAWISGFAFSLWVLLHRFRSVLKSHHKLEVELRELKAHRAATITSTTASPPKNNEVQRPVDQVQPSAPPAAPDKKKQLQVEQEDDGGPAETAGPKSDADKKVD